MRLKTLTVDERAAVKTELEGFRMPCDQELLPNYGILRCAIGQRLTQTILHRGSDKYATLPH